MSKSIWEINQSLPNINSIKLINSIKVNGYTYRGSNSTFSAPSLVGVNSLRKECAPSGANSFL